MRKCRNCLCRTCVNVCCDKKVCPEKKNECKRYIGFRQISIFDVEQPKPKPNKSTRPSWEELGLADKAYRKKLYILCQSRKYESIIKRVAYQTNKYIAEYIIKSVEQNKSFEKIEFDKNLGRICVCRTDFYGIRRRFYYFLNLELKRSGIKI